MSGKTVWTFRGSTAYRVLTGDEWTPFFDADPQYTRDAVLGAAAASDSYIDQGALVYEPLTMRWAFDSETARTNFITAHLLQQGTLSNTRGWSATALLVKAKRVDNLPFRYLDLTFERR